MKVSFWKGEWSFELLGCDEGSDMFATFSCGHSFMNSDDLISLFL